MLKILCKSLLISTTVEYCLWFQQVRWRAKPLTSEGRVPCRDARLSTTIAMPADISEEMPLWCIRRNTPLQCGSSTEEFSVKSPTFPSWDVSPGVGLMVRSLVERYGCIAGYPDGTFRAIAP